jgi:hypothetical protein
MLLSVTIKKTIFFMVSQAEIVISELYYFFFAEEKDYCVVDKEENCRDGSTVTG